MSNICPICGKKVGGLTGLPKPFSDAIEQGIQLGVYRTGMCGTCLSNALKVNIDKVKTSEEIKEEQNVLGAVTPLVFCSPAMIPDSASDLGLVTGCCILGTGVISEFLASQSDVLGRSSKTYRNKVRAAEREAIDMMKLECLKLGGDAVYCIRINITEATSAQGMIMVSVSGAAVKTKNPKAEILEAINSLNN